jgi:release factor glutamine methyltransferase
MHTHHPAPLEPEKFNKLMQVLKKHYDDREARNIAFNIEEYLFQLTHANFIDALKRLENKEPWQYITGKSWFYGLELEVNKNVLIPRQETEELVHLILQNHPDYPPLNVLDIGSGSGCIPLALQFNRPHWKIKGIDISTEALAIAQKNALNCGLHIEWEYCDFIQQIPTGRPWDIIVSNPPYISENEADHMPEHVLDYEPHIALFAPKDDALAFYRIIAEKGNSLLASHGYIYAEINEFRADATKEIFIKSGYEEVSILNDLAGKPRFISARKKNQALINRKHLHKALR